MEKTCIICGKTYENRDKRSVICSNDCYKILLRERYKNKLIDKTCKECGKPFLGKEKQLLCKECRQEFYIKNGKKVKANYERKKKRFIVNFFCKECGMHYKDEIVFKTKLKSTENKKNLCFSCYMKKMSIDKTGYKNPNWKSDLKDIEYKNRNGKIVKIRAYKVPESLDETKERMKVNNPMFNKDVVEKMSKTIKKKYENGEIERKFGKENPLWAGNRKPSFVIRTRLRYWVKSILKRDDYTCQNCLKRGGILEVHHKIPFREIVNLFINKPLKDYDVNSVEFEKLIKDIISYHESNDVGITYCKKCHSIIDEQRKI